MKSARAIALSFAFLAVAGSARALEYRSVGANPAIMYDTPSPKGRKVFVAPRGMPVEVVLTYGEWVKVRDAAGDLSWIHSSMLVPKRTVVVRTHTAKVRAAAEEAAPVVFTADKGVLLDFVDAGSGGWIHVRHRDGQVGFVRAAEVWGE